MNTYLKALLGVLLATGSMSLFGQACTQNAAYTTSPASIPNVNLCSATDQLAKTCANGTTLATGPDYIYSVTLGSPSSAVFTVNGTGFNPYIALMTGAACNSNDTCGSYENLGGPGSNVSLPSTNGLPAGQYWLVISDAQANITCPGATFSVSSTGTLPVKLQKFSVQ